MKKLLLVLCAAGGLSLASCTKKYIAPANQSYVTTIHASDWATTADGKADSVDVSAPQIDDFFNNSGAVLVYFSFYNGVYEQIPEVYNNVSYSYFHTAGHLVIYAQSADGTTPAAPTSDVGLKLVLIDAN